MKILGYIVTTRRINNIEGFVEQVNDIESADTTKPVLVVGWQNAKEFAGYKNVLDKQLDDNLYWTFSKSESRSDFEEDLKAFYKFVIDSVADKIEYEYLNIFNLPYSRTKKIINYLNSTPLKTIYISDNMLYMLVGGRKIYGLSLDILEYCNIKKTKIIDKIKENPNNRIYYDNWKDSIKLSKVLGNKKYAIPYFIE